MTKSPGSDRPAWTIHPPDIRRALKQAINRCYRLIGEARRSGNDAVVTAFSGVLDKIKEADQAAKEARAAYGWDSTTDAAQEEQ